MFHKRRYEERPIHQQCFTEQAEHEHQIQHHQSRQRHNQRRESSDSLQSQQEYEEQACNNIHRSDTESSDTEMLPSRAKQDDAERYSAAETSAKPIVVPTKKLNYLIIWEPPSDVRFIGGVETVYSINSTGSLEQLQFTSTQRLLEGSELERLTNCIRNLQREQPSASNSDLEKQCLSLCYPQTIPFDEHWAPQTRRYESNETYDMLAEGHPTYKSLSIPYQDVMSPASISQSVCSGGPHTQTNFLLWAPQPPQSDSVVEEEKGKRQKEIPFSHISEIVHDLCIGDDDEEEKNLEDFILVWLEDTSAPDDRSNIAIQLRYIVNFLKIFRDYNQCIEYMTHIHTEKILLIVSDSMAKSVISLVNEISQLVVVYVFRLDMNIEPMKHEVQCSKLGGIFNTLQCLLEKLRKDIQLYMKNIIPITLLSNSQTETDEKSIKNLNIEHASFMWFQLLVDLMNRSSRRNIAKEDLIKECRLFYSNNINEQKKITDFNDNYTPSEVLKWYTQDSFLYRLLNKAFRTENFEMIYKFRFVIIDLQNQIQLLHSQSIADLQSISKVYRGQGMHMDELQIFIKNIGKLISFNSFLSTTLNRELAVIFSGEGRTINEPVLFEMIINTTSGKRTKPFVRVEDSGENEVLLTMGTVFQIQSVVRTQSGLWVVELLSADFEDKQLHEFFIHIHEKEIQSLDIINELIATKQDLSSLINLINSELDVEADTILKKSDINEETYECVVIQRLGDCLLNMGQHVKAERFFIMALRLWLKMQCADSIIFLVNICTSVAAVRKRRGDYTKAFEIYEKMLGVIELCDLEDPTVISLYGTLYNNIGELYTNQTENRGSEALTCFLKSIEYLEKAQTKSPSKSLMRNIAITYHSLGLEYLQFRNPFVACDMIQKALSILEEIFSFAHPDFLFIYESLGALYLRWLDNPEMALSYHNKALIMQQKLYPPLHYTLGKIYHNIARVYQATGHREKTIEYLNQSLEIFSKSVPSNYPELVLLYEDFGLTYWKLFSDQEKDSFMYFGKALEIAFKNPPLRSQPIHRIIIHIRNLCLSIPEKGNLVEYFNEIIKTVPLNRSYFHIYFILGFLNEKQPNPEEALQNYEKAMQTLEIYVPYYQDILFLTGLPERIEWQKRLCNYKMAILAGDADPMRFLRKLR